MQCHRLFGSCSRLRKWRSPKQLLRPRPIEAIWKAWQAHSIRALLSGDDRRLALRSPETSFSLSLLKFRSAQDNCARRACNTQDKVALDVRALLEFCACRVSQTAHIIDHVNAEGLFEPLGDGSGSAGKFVALNFGYS